MMDEAPEASAEPRLAHVLGHPVVLVEIHGHGIALHHGWTCTAAVPGAR